MTKIEWTDETWNPTTGCTRVSEGCRHCYIERTPPMRMHDRMFETPEIGASTKGGVVLHPDRLDQPLRWKKPRRVFVNSMSDLFHNDISDEFIVDVFAAMALTRRHTFQVLTKRPRRMCDLLTRESFRLSVAEQATWVMSGTGPYQRRQLDFDDFTPVSVGYTNRWDPPWPLPNVWLGTSVENQEWADKRIPLLLDTPAAVRFLSCEPLLGPVDLSEPCWSAVRANPEITKRGFLIDWVIVGGESGPGARPMHPAWARSLRDQCVEADVPFFFKQWGEWTPDRSGQHRISKHRARYQVKVVGPNGEEYDQREMPEWWTQGAFMYQKGKKVAGRELDGRTWDEMPEVADGRVAG